MKMSEIKPTEFATLGVIFGATFVGFMIISGVAYVTTMMEFTSWIFGGLTGISFGVAFVSLAAWRYMEREG
jgi:hypothetical protein